VLEAQRSDHFGGNDYIYLDTCYVARRWSTLDLKRRAEIFYLANTKNQC